MLCFCFSGWLEISFTFGPLQSINFMGTILMAWWQHQDTSIFLAYGVCTSAFKPLWHDSSSFSSASSSSISPPLLLSSPSPLFLSFKIFIYLLLWVGPCYADQAGLDLTRSLCTYATSFQVPTEAGRGHLTPCGGVTDILSRLMCAPITKLWSFGRAEYSFTAESFLQSQLWEFFLVIKVVDIFEEKG